MVRVLKKRPCRVCRSWFLPDRRAGDRQKVCSRGDCQRERHRRNCRDYHAHQSQEMKEGRVLARVRKDGSTEKNGVATGGSQGGIDWGGVRDLVGLQYAIILEETEKVLRSEMRDLVRLEVAVIKRELGKVLPLPP